jgi:hypothetical protein
VLADDSMMGRDTLLDTSDVRPGLDGEGGSALQRLDEDAAVVAGASLRFLPVSGEEHGMIGSRARPSTTTRSWRAIRPHSHARA